jgi:NAD(P) transhydrogenase subunit alpha
MALKVGVLREIVPGERRVALVPETIQKLVARRLEVVVEAGAGAAAGFRDDEFRAAGAAIEGSPETILGEADVLLTVQPPQEHPALGKHLLDAVRPGAVLIGFLYAAASPDLARRLKERKVTSFAMELMPRITRAQSMDALSSMSNIAGYKAVLLAANALPRYFPMFMTAAGTITPSRVLVLGAGVAGLQAIATARRLGAVVEAYDVRPVVKEQVESLGARFVELPVATGDAQDAGGYAKEQSAETQERIRKLLHDHVKKADVVITTALVPGKKAPVLVTGDMVADMKAGSVIVDLAAEQGGNVEGTQAGKDVQVNGVVILGPVNLPAQLPVHASQLYSRNASAFLFHLVDKEGKLTINVDDELTRGPMVTRDGAIVHEATRQAVESGA